MLDRAHAKVDVRGVARTLLENGLLKTGAIGVDGQNRRRARRVLKREPSISAANLQDTFVSKTRKTLDQPTLEALPRICRQLAGVHRGIVSQSLNDSGRGGSSGRPSREEAAAKEGAFEGSISVHPASPEAGDLARGVEAG